jgi:hypothetical protein
MRVFAAFVLSCALAAGPAAAQQFARENVCPGGQCPTVMAPAAPQYTPAELHVDARPIARVANTIGTSRTLGTGTLVDVDGEQGLVVTCAHLFRDSAGTIVVTFPDGRAYAARLLRVDATADLAALAIAAPALEPVTLAGAYPQRGDPLVSCGYGSDGRLWCNRGQALGYVTTLGRQGRDVLELSGAARFGDSGGPVLNRDGHLVAVLFGTNGRVVDGTFCGRIRQFLAGLSPRFRQRAPDVPPVAKAPLPGPVEPQELPVDEPPQVVKRPNLPRPRAPDVEMPAGADPLPAKPSPLEEVARPWLAAKLAALLVAFGLPGGIAGVGGAAVAWLVMRRGKKKLESELGRLKARWGESTPVASGDAQPGMVERHHNRFVPFEVTELDKAWSAAHARVGEKYPGAVPYLKIVESVKDQLLSGVEERELS